MKTKKEIHVNALGLEFEVELTYVKKDDNGNSVNEYCVDEYSFAKMALYYNKATLLPLDVEVQKISNIIAVGVNNYIQKLGL